MNVFIAGVVIVVVLGLAFFFVLTVTEVGQLLRRRHTGPAIEPARDAATQELRLRYARGEISREEYLQRKIDLEEF